MIKLNNHKAPLFFEQYLKYHQPKSWEQLPADIRQELRRHILGEQQGCCAYTEIKLNLNNSHIDHFLKRDWFAQKTFDYDNLLVSCNFEYCGAKFKDKTVKSKAENQALLNPLLDDPADFLTFNVDGTVKAVDGNQRGEQAIAVFNLNCKPLVERRETALRSLYAAFSGMQKMPEEYLMKITKGEFSGMVRQLFLKKDYAG